MSWSEQKSSERVKAHIESIGEIEVKPLAREVNDLEALLSETVCREIAGSHTYAAVTNFADLASDSTMSRDSYQRLIQGVHVYQRELSHIAESIVGGYRVHFQGAKEHVLCYHPVNSPKDAATKAAFVLLIADDFIRSVFNKEFDIWADWRIGGGADIGDAIGTRNGKRGERELLFIGEPANRAAKIMVDRASLRLTSGLYDELPESLQGCCALLADGTYRISADQGTLDSLCAEHSIKWNREASAKRIADSRAAVPLSEIEYSGANERISFSDLSERNNKKVEAASVFADVSGFTKFVKDAEGDEEAQAAALKLFHVIRKESMRVFCDDFEGVHVQFQGDRNQGFLHLPKGDKAAICKAAVEAAISLASSFEQVIKKELPAAASLSLAIGVDYGVTLATRLGKRGERDNICLGVAVENAAQLEEGSAGGQIAISKVVFDALQEDLQQHFDADGDHYVATGLTWEKIDALEREEVYESGGSVALKAAATVAVGAAAIGAAIILSKPQKGDTEIVKPSRPYGRT